MNLKQILNALNPQPLIGGLKISDLNLRYIQIKGDKLITASLRMPPDIVKEGKVKDREKFIAVLKELHSQIVKNLKQKISVIVTIPDDNFYIQIFNLPRVAAANLEEAAKLNLQMISPIDFNNAYSDWQLIGEVPVDGNQLEVLGAFIQKDIIDDFEYCLKEAGFVVTAIECPAFSLSRLAIEWGANTGSNDDSYILLQIGTNGLGFNVIKQGNFCFNHFVSWRTVYGDKREVPFSDFKNIVVNEIQKVLRFYETHWSGQIVKLLLVSPRLHDEIIKIISDNFPFKAEILALKKFRDLEPVWFSVLGSAIRGLIPRSKDTIISLASTGTEKEFERQRIFAFIKIWRNNIIVSLAFVLILFLATDFFLIKTVASLNDQLRVFAGAPEILELSKLRDEASAFNKKVDLALAAKNENINWAPFLEKIQNLSGNNILINRIFIQSLETPVLINGQAETEELAINFKNLLSEQPQFADVNLPLASLTPTTGGVNFTVSFRIKSLSF